MQRIWFLNWSASSGRRSKEPRKVTVGHFVWSRYTPALGIFRGPRLEMAFTLRKPKSTILDVPMAEAGTMSPVFRHLPPPAAGWAFFVGSGKVQPACQHCH